MNKHAASVVLVVLLVGLQGRLWLSDDGIPGRQALKEQADKILAENHQLHIRNEEHDAEIADLKSGKAAIEARARESLGMIRPDETFFLVVH